MTYQNRIIYNWLWLGIGLILLMVIVGGITRLTGSGLSMTDWNLIMDAIPPLNEADWLDAFAQYQQFPEYQKLNYGMSLSEFKQIYFWEYLHRLLGRVLGLVFAIPLAIFWMRKWLSALLKKRFLILMGLGALQGAMGWFMVKSGLVDDPYVSHYRLAAHLTLALVLIGFCLWYALDIRAGETGNTDLMLPRNLYNWSLIIGILFFIQVIWGAFTAGLHAGYIYNTFPLMNGKLLPPDMWSLQPAILNLFDNLGFVQWIHRLNGTLLLLAVLYFWLKSRKFAIPKNMQFNALLLFGAIALQYVLGILTLINLVPLWLGVTHQAVAFIFGIIWLKEFHFIRRHSAEA